MNRRNHHLFDNPVPGAGPCPLSFQQERVLYLDELARGLPLWNRVSCHRLLGLLDVDLIREAVSDLVRRHSVLATRIRIHQGRPTQAPEGWDNGHSEPVEVDIVDLSNTPTMEREGRAQASLDRIQAEPMQLLGGKLFQVSLLKCGPTEHWLVFKLHHIISDATTLRIMWNDTRAFYNARTAGVPPELPALAIDSFDYACQVRAAFDEVGTREQEAYWLERFADRPPELDLPSDLLPPADLSFRGAQLRRALPPELLSQVSAFSFERRVIPFSTMLTAWYLLLRRYGHTDDLVVGTVFSGRHLDRRLNPLAGFFATTVALRCRIDPDSTVNDVLRTVHKRVSEAHDMQDYPLQRLVDRLHLERENRRNPLFRVMFNVVSPAGRDRSFEGVQREERREPTLTATQVDLMLDLHLAPDDAELRIEYNADLFLPAAMERVLRHYLVLLEQVLARPEALVRELGMVDRSEREELLALGRGERAEIEAGSIADLCARRAQQTPDQPALLAGDQSWTCQEVDSRANQLAWRLHGLGVGQGDRVAVMLDRSPEMVIGLLAILKAGAAYVPIDPCTPAARVEYLLEDCGARVLVVAGARAKESVRALSGTVRPLLAIDEEAVTAGHHRPPPVQVGPSAPATVIYTSGSTGRPKGVVVSHGAVLNTLSFLGGRFPAPDTTLLLKTSFTFDVSVSELFGWLVGTGRLAVLPPGAEGDPQALVWAVCRHGVTHIDFVPSMLDALLAVVSDEEARALDRLTWLLVAGEALPPALVERCHARLPNVQLLNLYGPTEAAIYATWQPLPFGTSPVRVPIGRPLPNTDAYVLDSDLEPVPVGVMGELYLSGEGIAQGYLGAPELTAERFVQSPFAPGQRLYATGDMAQWSEEGALLYLGRRDGQVKVRGFRVELGEVERHLAACAGVAEAAVRSMADGFGTNRLVGYLAWSGGVQGSIEELRRTLAAWLPAYMVPERFVELSALPRLPSGKVDRLALPQPQASPAVAPERAPTAMEQRIVEICEGLLNAESLDADSNFFHLGGNSLLTLRLIADLDDAFGTRLSVIDFLGLPTIGEMAELVQAALPSLVRALPQGQGPRSASPQ